MSKSLMLISLSKINKPINEYNKIGNQIEMLDVTSIFDEC